MAAEFEQLKKFKQKLDDAGASIEELAEDCTKDLAGRLLSYVIPDTPVGKNRGPGGAIKGGTLRRGWTAKTHAEAYSGAQGGNANGPNARNYAKELPVQKSGDTYTIDIINPVEYAMYVEYGHRTRNGKGFVPGQHMLTNSINKLEPQVPRILDKKVQKFLDELGDIQ